MANSDDWQPELYDKNVSFVYNSVDSLVQMLDPKPGVPINVFLNNVDLNRLFGCEVVGIDSSPSMVEKSIQKGVEAYVIDGHHMDYEEEFDAVFSNAALHWMKTDPKQVVKNIVRSLKPGGRFVAEFGGAGNLHSMITAIATVLERYGTSIDAVHPWYMPPEKKYVELLQSEGLHVRESTLFHRDTLCPSGPSGWLEVFGHPFVNGVSNVNKEKLFKEIEEELMPIELNHEGVYVMDYKRLRIHAVKI